MNAVKLIECPRAAWQSLLPVPAAIKAEYLRALAAAGFEHIDALAFTDAAELPQLAGSDAVLQLLEPPGFDPRADSGVEMLALVTTPAEAEEAIGTGAFSTLVFPYSISPTHLERAQRQTPEDALDALEQIGEAAYKAGTEIVAAVPMAFGNPYGDPWDVDEVVSALDLLADNGIDQVTLADTAGAAGPELLSGVLQLVLGVHDALEVGVALHPQAQAATNAGPLVQAAWQAGCRRFDAVLGGGGSDPLAGHWLPGLIATQDLLRELNALHAELPPLGSLDTLLRINSELARRYAPKVN